MFFERAEHFTGIFAIILLELEREEKSWKSKARHSTIDNRDNMHMCTY